MAKVASKFTTTQDLRSEVLKLEDGVEYIFRIEAPIKLGGLKPGSTEKSADTVRVTHLNDAKGASVKVAMLNAVVKSSIEEAFPDGGYVGKTFRVYGTGKVPGKRYKGYEVSVGEYTP